MSSRPWATLSHRARLRSRAVAPRRALSPLPHHNDLSTASCRAAPAQLASLDPHDADAELEVCQARAPVYRQSRLSQLPPSQPGKLSSRPTSPTGTSRAPRRKFHNYFVTHLPSTSLHPDRRHPGPSHGLPRDEASPHNANHTHSPAIISGPPGLASRDLTVVRIPLRSAKHHFGSASSRGTRPYNEDADQAGTIDMPAFAKRAPVSLVRTADGHADVTPADSSFGDPQIFYFAVFDGHGGSECAQFLKDELHGYIEEASAELGLLSSLGKKHRPGVALQDTGSRGTTDSEAPVARTDSKGADPEPGQRHSSAIHGSEPLPGRVRDVPSAMQKLTDLVAEYKDTVGGYFRRFQPAHFPAATYEPTTTTTTTSPSSSSSPPTDPQEDPHPHITVESVLEYAFLRADLDFTTAQAQRPDPQASDAPFDSDVVLGLRAQHTAPSGRIIGGRTRFKGGSTGTAALLSTPTPAPFWHPSAHATLVVAHVGDTRAILCDTATGTAVPATSDHHPTSPAEGRRLRRYAPTASLVTGDSFGEQRILGLANSRAFGDVSAKRVGVSAEPEVTRIDIAPAQFSFLVLCSDGVSGTLSDQEIVDTVKEAPTPARGAADVVGLATEVSGDGDNATCQVVRLGGWERRLEGGVGSMGTKEMRDLRRAEAQDPRRGKR